MSNPSTPTRRSGRLAGTPTVSSTPTTLVAKDEGSYTWGPPADDVDQIPDSSQRFYKSYVRRGFTKPTTKGKKKATSETQGEETFQKFSLGDGVLVAVLGNDVGVGILTKMWDEPSSDAGLDTEDDQRDTTEETATDERIKLCEVRWFYRKQDLPTTMNVLKVADVSTLLDCSLISLAKDRLFTAGTVVRFYKLQSTRHIYPSASQSYQRLLNHIIGSLQRAVPEVSSELECLVEDRACSRFFE